MEFIAFNDLYGGLDPLHHAVSKGLAGVAAIRSGWDRYKVRKHEDCRDITRAEIKQRLIAELGEFLRTTPKHRYIHFAGSDTTRRALRKALKLPVLKYPKRKATEPSMSLILQCYETKSRAESAGCAEPSELTQMEHDMLQPAQTLAEITMSRSDLGFVTL